MTDFKTIHGKKIKFLTTDLTMSTATEGELFYSDTDKEFKIGVTVEAWAAGGNLTTGRYAGGGGGTQTAGILGGGHVSPASTVNAETYDGSSWTEVGNLNTARMYQGGSGTSTATLIAGGDQHPTPRFSLLVEEYDGTNWAEQTDIPTATKNAGTCGTQTASLFFGGETPSGVGENFAYDGSSWTDTGHDLSTDRDGLRGAGTSTAALAIGGAPVLTSSEEYDGSSWTAGGTLNTGFQAGSASGTQTAALAFAGFPAPAKSVVTQSYDGTSWSTKPDMGTGRYFSNLGPIGTNTAALCAGGNVSSGSNATEEFTSVLTLKTITDS